MLVFRLPRRARPVPFWRKAFLLVPLTSPRDFVLCVPARRLASCQFTTRARTSRRTSTPKTSGESSISPAFVLSSVVTLTFMVTAPSRSQAGFLPLLPLPAPPSSPRQPAPLP